MAYIGAEPAERYVSLEAQNFTVSATTSYTLANSVTNENEIALFINNVRQQPGSSYAYTASGTTLTLSSATAATDTMYCIYLGKAVGTIAPPDNSVNSAQIVDGSITKNDIADLAGSKLTGTVTAKGDGSSTVGKLLINCEQNSHGITIQSPAHSAAANYTLTLPVNDGNANELLKTDGNGVLSWAVDSGGGPSLGTNHIIRTNAKTISENITFAGTENGMSAGPISIASGYTVTVTSGSTWSIVGA